MSFQFCWEYKDCREPCPVRDLRIVHCWRRFADEAEAGKRPCASCGYRLAWEECGFRAADFPAAPTALPNRRRPTILVVDDEPNILFALEETVSHRGFECASAVDGLEGLQLARGIAPVLVISDIIMPGLNGLELCQTLKSDPATSHIPVILVTVKVTERDRKEGVAAGADAFIFKPFSVRDLEQELARLLPPS